MLQNFQEITIDDPVDLIINQIRKLITSGQLKPGDKLPSERKLAERLGVSRSHVRDAIAKLDFYGILKTIPHRGTMVEGMGLTALEGLITDILKVQDCTFYDLVEIRVIIEKQSAAMAAERRTEEDLINIKTALDAYTLKVESGQPGVEEDLLFHLKIIEAAQNLALKSLMLIITPDIIRNFTSLDICTNGKALTSLEDHKLILQHIINQDPKLASQAMENHLQDVLDYAQGLVDDELAKTNLFKS